MAVHQISDYKAAWSITQHKGKISMKKSRGSWSKWFEISNPAEYQVCIDLLRNEKPIFFSTNNGAIFTRDEPVGEDEYLRS